MKRLLRWFWVDVMMLGGCSLLVWVIGKLPTDKTSLWVCFLIAYFFINTLPNILLYRRSAPMAKSMWPEK